MGGFKDILIAIPLGIILNIFVHQLASVLSNDLQYNDKFQRSLITIFIIGILCLVIGNTFFKTNKKYKNRVIHYGLNIGGILMVIYSTFVNWDKMEDSTKLVIFGLFLLGIVWYIYRWYDVKSLVDKKKSNDKKKRRNKEIKKIIQEIEKEQKHSEYNNETDSDLQ
jgi:hypothetical protein